MKPRSAWWMPHHRPSVAVRFDMNRRYLVLHLPRLATDRIRQKEPELVGVPIAAWAMQGNRRLLTGVDAPGTTLHVGQALADAQAMHPELALRDADPDGDRDLLERLALWPCVSRRWPPQTIRTAWCWTSPAAPACSAAERLRRSVSWHHSGSIRSGPSDRATSWTLPSRRSRRGGPLGISARTISGTGRFPESHAASFVHLAYASSWLKCHHPAVFAAALLNSQPMGFYAPAQIVRDAQQHDVEVRPLDINASDWDSTLERELTSADEHALRLGLRLASGLPGKRVG